jgi:uncharacterized repeat protein (TIGR01451 family)
MKYTLTILFLWIAFAGNAQHHVVIPDANLRAILEENFPQCFQNGLLDTLCAGSLTETGVGVEGQDIQSLEGMQYFKKFTSFYCADNLLTDLKFLPPNITWLNAPGNNIHTIHSLPKNLRYANLAYNELTSLPALPASLETLYLENNTSLNCLPLIPSDLKTLNITQTGVRCLPNKPGALNTLYPTTPLCNPANNPVNCQAFPVISGRLFVDLNNNGSKDPDEVFRKGVKVQIASEDLYTFSDNDGYYELSVPAPGSYTISISSPYYSAATVTVTASTANKTTHDIALKIVQAANDFSVSVVNYNFARPGFGMVLQIEINNIGSVAGPAEVRFAVPDLFTIDSSSIDGTLENSAIHWEFANIVPGGHAVIMLYGTLNPSATLGNTLKISVTVDAGTATDHDLTNNTASLSLIIRGAYDPNDKQGPDIIKPAHVANGEFIYYTIRFQNTGTDTAFTVIISDLLDIKLQAETLELLSSSHNCRTSIKNREVYFILNDILLPDSTTNKAASCGYVKFRIRPVTTLAEGESIPNTAGIYFDYNEPIITNTVQTQIREPEITTDIADAAKASLLKAFPNPADEGVLYISKGAQYKIYSPQGMSVLTGISDGSAISIHNLSAGFYLVEMNVGTVYKTEKIIVKK